MKQWNEFSGMSKKLDHFFDNKATDEFISVIQTRENLHTRNSVYVKSRASWGINAGTWMHPFLFIDFAMWLNPEFKYEVIKFVYDELIKYRNEAGDAYREMAASIRTIVPKKELPVKISHVAKAINHIVCNSHETEIRNKLADESKVKELAQIEKDVAMLINGKFIKSFDSLINHFQELWREKYVPKELA